MRMVCLERGIRVASGTAEETPADAVQYPFAPPAAILLREGAGQIAPGQSVLATVRPSRFSASSKPPGS
jgi:hypothetical protein